MIKLNQVAPCLSCFCWRLVGSICTAVDVGLIIDIQFDRSSFGAVSEQFQSSFRAVVNLFLRSPRVWNVLNCNCILRVPMAISEQFQCSFSAVSEQVQVLNFLPFECRSEFSVDLQSACSTGHSGAVTEQVWFKGEY